MQWTGLWAMPGIVAGIGDDFGVLPWPALDAQGTPATFWGGWSEMVNAARTRTSAEAKKFVNWLWIQKTDLQQDWALSYGFHVPPRQSAAAAAEPLKSGPGSEAVTFLNDTARSCRRSGPAAMETIVERRHHEHRQERRRRHRARSRPLIRERPRPSSTPLAARVGDVDPGHVPEGRGAAAGRSLFGRMGTRGRRLGDAPCRRRHG